MKELCKLMHIKKLISTPYHPEANGLVEKFNGTLTKMLTCFLENEKKMNGISFFPICYSLIGKCLRNQRVSLHLNYFMGGT